MCSRGRFFLMRGVMTGNRQPRVDPNKFREGSLTIEFITGLLVLMVPFLFAISEVLRVELTARRTIMGAQEQCLIKAVQMNRNRHYQVLSVPALGQVEIMDGTRRIFRNWGPGVVELERIYYIGSGAGRD